MTDSGGQGDRVWVAIHKQVALVRVEGRGSFKSSAALKEFGRAAIEAGCQKAVIDLSACVGMDSTFMGTLAGIASRLRQLQGGGMVLLNLNPRVRGLVATLGLDRLVEVYEAGATPEAWVGMAALSEQMRALENEPGPRDLVTQTMIEAHENLVAISPDNVPRFRDVLMYLRDDSERRKAGASQGGNGDSAQGGEGSKQAD